MLLICPFFFKVPELKFLRGLLLFYCFGIFAANRKSGVMQTVKSTISATLNIRARTLARRLSKNISGFKLRYIVDSN